MNPTLKLLFRVVGLALVAVVTFTITSAFTRKPEAAASTKAATSVSTRDPGIPEEYHRKAEASRVANRRDFIQYREIIGVRPVSDVGEIGLVVDVECWHGAKVMPGIPETERAFRLQVCVYSPDDPHRQNEPLKVWESDAVEMVEGLYQERVPVTIALDPNPNPYPVTIEIVSAQPVLHKPLGRAEEAFVPTGYCGTSRMITVR